MERAIQKGARFEIGIVEGMEFEDMEEGLCGMCVCSACVNGVYVYAYCVHAHAYHTLLQSVYATSAHVSRMILLGKKSLLTCMYTHTHTHTWP